MNSLPPNPDLPRKTIMDRIQALFEVLLLSGLFSSVLAGLILHPFYGKKPPDLLADAKILSVFLLLESAVTFLILAVILKFRREAISSLGLRWHRWKFHFAVGLALVPLLFLLNGVVTVVFQTYFPQYYLAQNPLIQLIQTPRQLVLIIFSALIAGGIKEELQRAFILTRFREYLGGAGIGLIVWSIGFGAGHYVQGVQGVVAATIYGLIFGIIYLQSRSLIAPITAHGAYDSVALIAYWFLARHMA
jgi:membrane protease YdiL (CAAX protease family)